MSNVKDFFKLNENIGEKSNLFIFSDSLDNDLMKDLIETSYEHFDEIYNKNTDIKSSLLSPLSNENNMTVKQNKKSSPKGGKKDQSKDATVIEWISAELEVNKSIYESEKSKIKGNLVKIEINLKIIIGWHVIIEKENGG